MKITVELETYAVFREFAWDSHIDTIEAWNLDQEQGDYCALMLRGIILDRLIQIPGVLLDRLFIRWLKMRGVLPSNDPRRKLAIRVAAIYNLATTEIQAVGFLGSRNLRPRYYWLITMPNSRPYSLTMRDTDLDKLALGFLEMRGIIIPT